MYEFPIQLNTIAVAQEEQLVPAEDKRMACVAIPFHTVVGINISTTTSGLVNIVIEVDTVPAMWGGTEVLQQRHHGSTCSRLQYNTSHTVDFTNGQLLKVPYHKVSVQSWTCIYKQL